MLPTFILDDDHNPVPEPDMEKLGEWMFGLDSNHRVVIGQTKVNDNTLLSTVFLGVDHGFGAWPPVLFETMAFVDGGKGFLLCRYSSYAEAAAGHAALVQAALQTPPKHDQQE